MRIWLSIDWDYFCRQPRHLWHNGVDEKVGAQPITWGMRAALSLVHGSNLRNETSLSHADPPPGRFWRALKGLGMRFDEVQHIRVAESHKAAYEAFRGPDTANVTLVNFDAHHDLFYASKFAVSGLRKEKADCGNWHLLTLLRYPKLRSVTVYPHWKGWSEWKKTLGVLREHGSKGEKLVQILHQRTRANVWPRVKLPKGQVERIFICRSGAWTPPWHDQSFIRFVNEAENTAKLFYLTWDNIDEISPRPFNWKQVEQVAALEARLLGKRCING